MTEYRNKKKGINVISTKDYKKYPKHTNPENLEENVKMSIHRIMKNLQPYA